jgi:phosphatidylglycerophosphate synthase
MGLKKQWRDKIMFQASLSLHSIFSSGFFNVSFSIDDFLVRCFLLFFFSSCLSFPDGKIASHHSTH